MISEQQLSSDRHNFRISSLHISPSHLQITFALCLFAGMATALFPLKKVLLVKKLAHSLPSIEKHVYVNHHTTEYHDSHHSAEKRDIPYTYEYGVQDHRTGDHKSAWEKHDGHNVVGGYTMREADGSLRVVNYKADPIHGFQADVKYVGKH